MCIAIVKTKKGKISEKQLKNCFRNNPDGAGIAYSKQGKIYYIKGIFEEKRLIKEYRKAEKEAEGAMLIHCRIGTSGLKDANNCHPHVVNDQTVMIHNGIIHEVEVPAGSKESDTIIYTHEVLSNLPKDFMNYPVIIDLIANHIGNFNKICFLNNKGEFAIANEKQGDWKDGVWFSNTSYQGHKTRTLFGSSSKSYYGKSYSSKPYSYYDSYEDDYEDYSNYEFYDDENDDLYDELYTVLEDYIGTLGEADFIALGDEVPLVDKKNYDLLSGNTYITRTERERDFIPLDEFSYHLLGEYINRKEEVMGLKGEQECTKPEF